MSMLKKAENKMAYAKVGLYGDAKSGKTFTSAKIATGLHQYANLQKPVGMFDTEGASSYIVPVFKKAGVELLVYDESRALRDLMAFMDEAEKECSIVIIDSITHVWRDVQESYLAKINEARIRNGKKPITRLEFQDWGPIKSVWGKFTDRYLTSKLHCIVCGRAGAIYEYQDNERTGKKELITTGKKMATEKELGYEPSLLIEMEKRREDGTTINFAIVDGDRSDTLNGLEIPRPTFESFKPHFELLNLGGSHIPSTISDKDSREMFDASGDDDWHREKRQREIWCEEIKNLMIKHGLDGTASEVKKRRLGMLESAFGTGAWTAIENMKAERIRDGFEQMKAIIEPPTVANGGMDDDAKLTAAFDAIPVQ